jgi:hypothetical protein
MKITIEQHEEIFTYESELDSMDMSELTEKLYGLCIAAGYHPDSVGECFYTKGQEMTEHLYPDDNVLYPDDKVLYPDDKVEEDVVSSGVYDLIQGGWPSVVVKSRYGAERKFNVLAKNCVEYSFEDDGHVGVQRNDDGSLESVDPSGGPYIGIGTNLGEYIHKDLGDLTVTKIKVDEHEAGTYYLTVK